MILNKEKIIVLIIWSIILFISYTFIISKNEYDENDNLYVKKDRKSHIKLVDAIVLIAMGSMAEDTMIDYSISSIRKLGKHEGSFVCRSIFLYYVYMYMCI